MSIIIIRLRYFQHAHFIPIVGVEKKRHIIIGLWRCKGSTALYWNYLENVDGTFNMPTSYQ